MELLLLLFPQEIILKQNQSYALVKDFAMENLPRNLQK